MWNRGGGGGNARQTGSNEAPLGGARRWGGADQQQQSQGAPPPPPSSGYGGGGGGYQDQRGGGGYGGGGGGGYGGQSGGGGGYGRDERDGRGGGYGGGREDRGGGGGRDDRDYDRGRSDSRPQYDRGPPPPSSQSYSSGAPTRSAWDAPSERSAPQPSAPGGGDGERKRKSRWGDAAATPGGMPTAITGGVEGKDLESYATQLRLDEIARALRSGLVVPPDGARSPSPPPMYDSHGRRTNTREVRYRKKLEDERMRLVDRQVKLDPSFRPPTEYVIAKRSNGGRPQDKVYIPVKEFPEINFFGLLVGPRGNSLKGMERDSGAKISIRGKGSVKEGKGRPGGGFDGDENDELHCLVTGDTEEKVQRCVKLINSVIEIAASVPEAQNDHKRSQLRELATLNGTLRDDEGQVCQNCGNLGHRKYDCPEQKNWTAGIICRTCGGAGHMARDCMQRPGRPGFGMPPGAPGFMPNPNAPMDQARAQQFDSEYASLMAELGETSATAPLAAAGTETVDPVALAQWQAMQPPPQPLDENGEKIPPWRIPGNWNPPQLQGGGYRPPPQEQYGGGGGGYQQQNVPYQQY